MHVRTTHPYPQTRSLRLTDTASRLLNTEVSQKTARQPWREKPTVVGERACAARRTDCASREPLPAALGRKSASRKERGPRLQAYLTELGGAASGRGAAAGAATAGAGAA
jgi:hypothetical protein